MHFIRDEHPAVKIIYNYLMEKGYGSDPDGRTQWDEARKVAQFLNNAGLLVTPPDTILELPDMDALEEMLRDETRPPGRNEGEEGRS
jgi:hypothetical protein